MDRRILLVRHKTAKQPAAVWMICVCTDESRINRRPYNCRGRERTWLVLPDSYWQWTDLLAADVVDGKICTTESPSWSHSAAVCCSSSRLLRLKSNQTYDSLESWWRQADKTHQHGCRWHTDAVAGCKTGIHTYIHLHTFIKSIRLTGHQQCKYSKKAWCLCSTENILKNTKNHT